MRAVARPRVLPVAVSVRAVAGGHRRARALVVTSARSNRPDGSTGTFAGSTELIGFRYWIPRVITGSSSGSTDLSGTTGPFSGSTDTTNLKSEKIIT